MHLEEAKPAGEANSLLEGTFASILEAASAQGVASVGMPAIGAGVLGFPSGRAAKVALGAFAKVPSDSSVKRVDMALLDDSAFASWSGVARALLGEPTMVGEAGVETYDLRRLVNGSGGAAPGRVSTAS